jgi:hypothetical protein
MIDRARTSILYHTRQSPHTVKGDLARTAMGLWPMSQCPLEQRLQRHLPALHGAFDPMPAPAQMNDIGQGGTRQAALRAGELAVSMVTKTIQIKYAVPAGSAQITLLTALAARHMGCAARG